MRRPFGSALAVAMLLALSSSWAAGWAVAWHVASDDHHGRPSSDEAYALGLEMVAHGHLHPEGTPAHGHPAVSSAAGSLPGRLSILAPAMTGDALESVGPTSRQRLSPEGRPNPDPPPRGVSVSILRI